MSLSLSAEEFVFTNLSAKHSPLDRGGYQIVYAGPSLGEADQEAIQQRVSGFTGGEDAPARAQYFKLLDGRAVVTRTQAIPADAEFSDRRGGFLAYGLVLSAAEFARAGSDPFRLYEALDPPNTAREIVERYGRGASIAPAVKVTPAPPSEQPATWSGTALWQLLSLGLAARDLATSRRSVFFNGPEPARLQAIRVAIQITPRAHRDQCTFDSEGRIDPGRPSGLWALGSREQPRDAAESAQVDAGRRQVSGKVPPLPAGFTNSLYGRWFQQAVPEGESAAIFRPGLAAHVEGLAAALESRGASRAEVEMDAETAGTLRELWREEIHAALDDRLRELSSTKIAAQAGPWLQHKLSASGLLEAAQWTSSALTSLASHLAEWLRESTPKLPEREWARLMELAAEGSSPLLAALASGLGRLPDDPPREAALAQLEPAEFSVLLPLCPGRIAPRLLAGGAHTPALVQRVIEAPPEEEALVELVEQTLARDEGDLLAPLKDLVLGLSAGSLRRLARRLQESASKACPFREELVAKAASATRWWQKTIPGTSAPARDKHSRPDSVC
jgi:hypothetical protein